MKITKIDGIIGALIYGAVKVLPQLHNEGYKIFVIALMLVSAVLIHFISLKYKGKKSEGR